MNDIENTLAIAKAISPLHSGKIVQGGCIDSSVYIGNNYDKFDPLFDANDSQMVQAHFRITVDISEPKWNPQISAFIEESSADVSTLYKSDETPTPELIRRAIFESAYLKVKNANANAAE